MSDCYTLRLASLDDREGIMSFIKKNWLEKHILANDIGFFDYQYKSGNNIQFIIAVNSNNIIKGILGFIQYDPDNEKQDIFLVVQTVFDHPPMIHLHHHLLHLLQMKEDLSLL